MKQLFNTVFMLMALFLWGATGSAFAIDHTAASSGSLSADLQYGNQQLANNNPQRALLTFDRAIINHPMSLDARLGLTETYVQLGMYDEAKTELTFLEQHTTDPTILASMRKLSREMATAETSPSTRNVFYASLAMGYDSNITHSAEEAFGDLMPLVGLQPSDWDRYLLAAQGQSSTLDATQRRTIKNFLNSYSNKTEHSPYITPQIGFKGSQQLGGKWDAFWDINAEHQYYTDHSDRSITEGNLFGELYYNITPTTFLGTSAYYQEYLLDGNSKREVPNVGLSLGHLITTRNLIKVYANTGMLVYPKNNINNMDTYLGGVSWMYFIPGTNNLLDMRLSYGRNKARNLMNNYNSNHGYLASITFAHALSSRVTFELYATYQLYRYDTREFSDASRREDKFFKLMPEISVKLNRTVHWFVAASYIDNHSNLPVHRYHKYEVETGIGITV